MSQSPKPPEPQRGIVCPVCECPDVVVTNTERLSGRRVRRRRECQNDFCGHRFVTVEKLQPSSGKKDCY